MPDLDDLEPEPDQHPSHASWLAGRRWGRDNPGSTSREARFAAADLGVEDVGAFLDGWSGE